MREPFHQLGRCLDPAAVPVFAVLHCDAAPLGLAHLLSTLPSATCPQPFSPVPPSTMWGAFRATRPVLDGRIRFTKPLRLSQSAKANRRTVTARMQANAHLIREGKVALANGAGVMGGGVAVTAVAASTTEAAARTAEVVKGADAAAAAPSSAGTAVVAAS